MRILYLDLETTGTNSEKHQILEIGMVFDIDWNIPIENQPQFHCNVMHDLIQGQAFALQMNAAILKRIAIREQPHLYLSVGQVAPAIVKWLRTFTGSEKIVVGGKNVAGFDLPFLSKLPGISKSNIGKFNLYHRTVDPAMLYLNPDVDNVPPDLATCLQRAGLNSTVSHTAIDDCFQTARCVRAYYAKEKL